MANYDDMLKSINPMDLQKTITHDMLPQIPNYDFSRIDEIAASKRREREQVSVIAKHASSMDNNLKATKEDVAYLKDTILSLTETVQNLKQIWKKNVNALKLSLKKSVSVQVKQKKRIKNLLF